MLWLEPMSEGGLALDLTDRRHQQTLKQTLPNSPLPVNARAGQGGLAPLRELLRFGLRSGSPLPAAAAIWHVCVS
jgi:hypothetical protein